MRTQGPAVNVFRFFKIYDDCDENGADAFDYLPNDCLRLSFDGFQCSVCLKKSVLCIFDHLAQDLKASEPHQGNL